MRSVPFTKVHGLGNDYVLLDRIADAARLADDVLSADAVRRMCDRRRGVGADGVLVLESSPDASADARLWIINRDGSPGGVCGTGTRCAAAHLVRHHGVPIERPIRLIVGDAGRERLTSATIVREGDRWLGRVDMGAVDRSPERLPADAAHLRAVGVAHAAQLIRNGRSVELTGVLASVGNPHMVCVLGPANPGIGMDDVGWLGEALQRHPAFPQGVNLHLVAPEIAPSVRPGGPAGVRIITCERGSGVVTACTTGACAAAAACAALGMTGPEVRVISPGGELLVVLDPGTGRVCVEGEAVQTMRGIWDADFGGMA
jgi:diaminopimelate epimerase